MLSIVIEDEDRGRWEPLAARGDGTRVLVILAGAGFAHGRLRAEAARADHVVAADAGAGLALDAGLPLAAVVGDFDSLDARTLERLDRGLLHPNPDPHTNDLEKALVHVAGAWGARVEVALAAGGHVNGGRMDHALANLGPLLREPHARVSMLDGEGRLFALRRGRLRVAGGEGRTISLLPWTLHGVNASETGMQFPLDHAHVKLGGQGLSNRIVAPVAELTVRDGVALVWVEA